MDLADVRRRGRNPYREKHQLGALEDTTGGGVSVPMEGGAEGAREKNQLGVSVGDGRTRHGLS